MVQITVSAARRTPLASTLPTILDLPSTATVADLKTALAAKYPKLYVSRQKLSLKDDTSKKALNDDATLQDANVAEGTEIIVKDLGPQISWRTVFLVEYDGQAGPLIIHPLLYHYPKIFYGGNIQHSTLQRYVYGMVIVHFVKRELETLFVHRFSHATMPAFNIFKNSAHYWFLSGVLLAWSIYSPWYGALSPSVRNSAAGNPTFLSMSVLLWAIAELSNLKTHLTLRSLRPAGSRKLGIPKGYGFGLVSCPNYFFECMGWLIIAGMTGSWAAWLFLAVSGTQMALWALKKHKNYKKVFGPEYPRGRKAMIPFIL
ncbi:uncharacterized protein STEHIDRAFT_141777 [Stereum hirsutum FP-91666 SS1]|uniref:uncharacterized protein n=1 Tax=Stereum hirsutum (strain FP-91666) TaxID=721885 RepID=UPI0004449A16|nr:uncharacterized protein STEHIDRAFT_141777 [Stereum hirsutum FP-91666 SS1]EIM82531.1 hypothetical protein STEHIDRAFT_141777 [Stereum hirsutum FP-91666 SS1]